MKNSTNINIPKKYEPMIKAVFADEDGIWVALEKGFYAAGMGVYDECHVIHVDKRTEVMAQIRQIKPLNKED